MKVSAVPVKDHYSKDNDSDDAMQDRHDAPAKNTYSFNINSTRKNNQRSMLMSSSSSSLQGASSSSSPTSAQGGTRSRGRVSFSDDEGPGASPSGEEKSRSVSTLTSSFRTGKLRGSGSRQASPDPARSSLLRTGGKENGGNSSPGTSNLDPELHHGGSPRKWNIGKRFSLFGGSSDVGKRKNGYGTLDDGDAAEVPTPSEADPVMTIFESRNTQRVRFRLEGVDGDSTAAAPPPVGSGVVVGSLEGYYGPGHHGGGGSNVRPGSSSSSHSGGGNIKQFMSRALFGSSKGGSNSKKLLDEEMEREAKELTGGSLIWESATTPTDPEVVHTHNRKGGESRQSDEILVSFTEDPKARAAVTKLLSKARKAEHVHFRYEYGVKCYLKALSILKKAKYPDDHPMVAKTVRLLNNAHHVLSSYNNSANIVKMGIKNEDAGELVKALKMYTIAYRIWRDNLSRNHPSLVVLLNMLGSIQIKRGELKEAMQIYELALNDSPVMFSAAADEDEEIEPSIVNLLAKSVTYREMGTIYEMWGNVDEALKFFHKSLECVAEWRDTARSNSGKSIKPNSPNKAAGSSPPSVSVPAGEDCSTTDGSSRSGAGPEPNYSIDNVQPISCVGDRTESGSGIEHGEMELVIGTQLQSSTIGFTSSSGNVYERFFPKKADAEIDDGRQVSDENSHADMDLSLTLHQIAQLYRAQGKYARALDAYEVALRGMKTALGKHHPNVAAVLGNIGNLQKEMGDLAAAYMTYQEVLGIESYRLGLSHPDVAITLHNIATIDAARGNYEHSLQLYRKVIGLQKKLFGEDNLSVAVTAACMGDVYEKIGELRNSMESFDEAVRIKSGVLGRHSLDVGRLLHKLGKLSFLRKDYLNAESYVARAILIYRLNKLGEDHEWFVDANRDTADIDGAIAMGIADQCEI